MTIRYPWTNPMTYARRRLVQLLGTASLAAALLVPAAGCAPSRTPAEAKADLTAADPEVRMRAARDIEATSRDNTLSPDVVDALLAQAQKETDTKTKGSIMITLGYTGDPRAKPLLEAYAQTSDVDQQRWAGRALKKFAVKSGQLPATHEFPDSWPYGTPGYPPPAVKQ
jgi:hypothetical protein